MDGSDFRVDKAMCCSTVNELDVRFLDCLLLSQISLSTLVCYKKRAFVICRRQPIYKLCLLTYLLLWQLRQSFISSRAMQRIYNAIKEIVILITCCFWIDSRCFWWRFFNSSISFCNFFVSFTKHLSFLSSPILITST